MKKLLFAAAMLSFVFTCCNNAKNGSPKEVLMAWFDAMFKNDMSTVKELSTPESQKMINMMEMAMKNPSAAKETGKYDKTKMEFGDPIIDGDNAKVPVKDKEKGETTNFPMKKINGQWKVAFDKGSMMQMGMDKMKEGNMNIGDSVNKAMDEMKNMNMDSLGDEIKNAMDTSKMNP